MNFYGNKISLQEMEEEQINLINVFENTDNELFKQLENITTYKPYIPVNCFKLNYKCFHCNRSPMYISINQHKRNINGARKFSCHIHATESMIPIQFWLCKAIIGKGHDLHRCTNKAVCYIDSPENTVYCVLHARIKWKGMHFKALDF